MDFPLLLSLVERLDRAAFGENQVGIVIVNHFVNLPNIQMIGPQAPQRFFEHSHRKLFISLVRADLRHQENLVALPFQALAHPLFALAEVIIPNNCRKR